MDTAPGSDPGEVESQAGEVESQADDSAATVSDGVTGGPVDASATDPVDDSDSHDPLRFNNWMKRSAAGAVLSGIALGLQQALETKRELPAFIMEAPGEPEDPDAPFVLHFDPDDPTKTVAVMRSQSPAERTEPSGGTDTAE